MGYLFIGNFSSKILNLLLVPLYTYVLSTSEYGTYDLVYSSILMLIPFFSVNIVDAIMRFSIDTEDIIKKHVFSIATKYTLVAGGLFLVCGIIVIRIWRNPTISHYFFPAVFLSWMLLLNQNIVQIVRGLDGVKTISIAGILGTCSTIFLNILFLIYLKMGLEGYFYANIISLLIQNCFLVLKNKIYLYISNPFGKFTIEREMLAYCVPLISTTVGWYINGVADRYAVTYFEGLSANGIYSISYKIPTMLITIETIFIQSWQLSAAKELTTEEGESFFNRTYVACQSITIVLCSLMIMSTRVFAKILFSADFYDAWRYVPTLIFYVLFNTLSGTIGGIFVARKTSKILAQSAIIGAFANIVLNIVLISFLGVEGAALATAISSVIIWYIRFCFSKQYVHYHLDYSNSLLQFAILVVQAFSMSVITSPTGYIIQLSCFFLLLIMNWKEFYYDKEKH